MSRRSRLSTSSRVALAATAVLVLGVVALSAISYFSVSARLRADTDRTLLREAEAFSAAVTSASATDAVEMDLRALARSYLEGRSAAYLSSYPVLIVRLASGAVVSNSEVALDQATANATALDTASATRRFLDVSFGGEIYRAATVPVTDSSGAVVAVFEAALPTSPTSDLEYSLLVTLAVGGAIVVLLGALLSAVAARASLSRLRLAAVTADRISHARLNERIDYAGPNDDVGRLVAAVNAMLDRLESGFAEQRRFLADASHELRTPLAIVSGHLEVLRRGDLVAGEGDEELAVAADEVARMGRLVDDMLALARLEAGAPRPFQPLDVGVLLLEVMGRARMLADRRFSVQAEDGLWVRGDPDQLLQAMLNLVGNAVAHTHPGGAIVLSAGADAAGVRLGVADTGTGIRASELDRIFDRFYRAQGPRGSGGGSGLGLAITKRLVELHGGTVSAANRERGGAVFTVLLPRVKAPQDAAGSVA